MGFGQNPTTGTQGSLPANQFPLSSVAVPGTANGDLTALEGGPASTDSNNNKTAPASMYVKDGGDVTQGAKADTAITDSTTTNSKMSFLKGLVKILADIWDSTNHRIKVDGSGVTQPVSGTVTSNIGTTNGLALDTSINGVIVSQGSTTSGEKGPLVQGAVTTSAPSYTTAQTSPLSLTTAGAVRVDGSAVTQPVSGTFWQATQPISGAITANAGTNLNTSSLALESGGNLASAKTDLDSINTTTGATTDAAVLGDVNGSLSAKLRGLSKILNALIDVYGSSATISAQTTLAAIPTTSGLVTNSFATLTNSSYQDTFIVQINVASAFVGTIGFYGLLPDGNTLQQINAHQRGTATNGNSTAINTSSALEQTWEGSIAGFKAIYVICSSYTSGTATVQLGLSAANYAHAILNTVASNLAQVGGSAFSLGQATKNTSLPVTIASDQGNINNASVGTDGSAIPASSTLIGASDGTNLQQLLVESASNRNLRTAIYNAANELGIDAGGRLTTIMQAVAGTALAADQGNTELRVSTYIKTSTAGDTALTAGQATMANSLPVTMASDQTPKVTSTVTKTSVAAATSDTAILASNSSRKGAKFYNDSTAICYLSEGSGAASTSSYTVQIPANGFYEMPPEPLVTVAYRAIWSAANGNLRVTENT